LRPEQVQVLSQNTQVTPAVSGATYIQADEAGHYRIFVNIMSPEPELAQSACNVILNGQPVTTIQTNGTEGKWIRQKLVKVELEAGLYEMKLDFVKPGLQIEWIEFKQV
ncbi:hypothetical protein KC345_g8217, partial [Hortaea werneckii]